MAKYVQTGTPRKTVGAYLRAVKALNELRALGEDVKIHPWRYELNGVSGVIAQDEDNGEWRFVQA